MRTQGSPQRIARFVLASLCTFFLTHTLFAQDCDCPVPAFVNPPPNTIIDCADLEGLFIPDLDYTNGETGACEISGTVPAVISGAYNICGGTVAVTWTYQDTCGNLVSHIQNIDVVPADAPSFIDPPADTSFLCGDLGSLVIPDLAYTNGGSGMCTFSGSVPGVVEQQSADQATMTWKFTDPCGTIIAHTRTITLLDDEAPQFETPPANIQVGCLSELPAMIDLSWTDNCDGTGMVLGVEISDGSSCPETIRRTWSYTDAAGNEAEVLQVITVSDDIPPVLSAAPPDITVSNVANVPAMEALSWSDNCDGSGTVAGVEVSDGGSNPEIITRTWTYSDACGNRTSTSQVITLIPENGLTITCPGGMTVNCPQDIPPPDISQVIANGSCILSSVVHLGDEEAGFVGTASCSGWMIRWYAAYDDCGNADTCFQEFVVMDKCDPTSTCPECEEDVPEFLVDFSNQTDSLWLSPLVEREGLCCDAYWQESCIRFNVIIPEDVLLFKFFIESGPVPDGELYYQFSCGEQQSVGEPVCSPAPGEYQVTFCAPGNGQLVYGMEVSAGDLLPDTITAIQGCPVMIGVEGLDTVSVSWKDLSGNGQYEGLLSCTSGCLQTSFLADTIVPSEITYRVCGDLGSVYCGAPKVACDTFVVRVYPDIEAEVYPEFPGLCDGQPDTLFAFVQPTSLDYQYQWVTAQGQLVGEDPFFVASEPGTYSLIVSYGGVQGIEPCMSDTVISTVFSYENPDPVFPGPLKVCIGDTIEFGADWSSFSFEPSAGIEVLPDHSGMIVWTSEEQDFVVTATDENGCSGSASLTIQPYDCIQCSDAYMCTYGSEQPVFNTVSEFVAAGGGVQFPCPVSDSSIQLVWTVAIDNISCPQQLYLYEITDSCGNVATCQLLESPVDTIPPTWTSSPALIGVVPCGTFPEQEDLTAGDECGFTIVKSIDPFVEDPCHGYEITLRWSLVDECGNAAPDQAITFSVEPVPAPYFIDVPSDLIITCAEATGLTIPDLAYTNGEQGSCEVSGTVPGVLSGTYDQCGGQLTATWSFTDICGNTIAHTQTISVLPAPSPSFLHPMADTTLDYQDALGYMPPELAYSNGQHGLCEVAGVVPGVMTLDFNELGGHIMVEWTYTGVCGNMITHSILMIVNPLSTSTADIVSPGKFRLLPNPARSGSHVLLSGESSSSKVEVSVVDVHGRVLVHFEQLITNGSSIILDAGLEPGVYYVVILSENIREVIPLVVVR